MKSLAKFKRYGRMPQCTSRNKRSVILFKALRLRCYALVKNSLMIFEPRLSLVWYSDVVSNNSGDLA